MNQRRWLAFLAFLLLPTSLLAQDAHSLGIGQAATAAPMGIFGVYWNPAVEALPDSSQWTLASGFSAFDTSNAGSPILRFNSLNAAQSTQDPIQRFQQYQGLAGVKYAGFTFGVLYDQELNYLSSQGAIALFNDRAAGPLSPGTSYNLNYQQTKQQIETLVLSYSMPFPLGSLPFLSVGGSLKYHDGTQYDQTVLTGTYTQGSTTGYQYTRTTSNSGLGLSIDVGLLGKVSDLLQVGLMIQNLQSSFNWQAQQQTYNLDPNTGQDIPVPGVTNVTVSQPFPYTTKLGIAIAPPEKNTYLEGEVSWVDQQTHWRAGFERFYPENGLTIRLGTFADDISGQQLWTFGLGYLQKSFFIDIAVVTRSIPDFQDSVALGGAVDAGLHF